MITVPEARSLPQIESADFDLANSRQQLDKTSLRATSAFDRKRRSRLIKQCAIGGFALLAVLGALQTRLLSRRTPDRIEMARMQALKQVSSLLLSAPASADAVSLQPGIAADLFGAFAHEAKAQDKSEATQSAPVPLILGTRNQRQSEPRGIATPQAVPLRARFLHHEIPVAIEGDSILHPEGDGLAGLTVLASLRVFDGRGSPLRLLATRIDNGALRARMQERDPAGGILASDNWLSVGDSPAPGWQVLEISPIDVLLLTPFGNPLRLRLSAGGNPLPTQSPPGKH